MNNLNAYTKALQEKKQDLESKRRRADIAIVDSADPLDKTREAAERDLSVSLIDLDSRLLQDVRNALLRVDQGRYGECEHCEEPISERRLKAVPWARLCLDCQDAVDRPGVGRAGKGYAFSDAA